MIKNWLNAVFETKGPDGKRNGSIRRIWEADTELLGYRPMQVYVTTIAPRRSKGPHRHNKRDSLFCCVHGKVFIEVHSTDGGLARELYCSGECRSGEWHHRSVHVPAGYAATITNYSFDTEAIVINCSSGKYDPEDDHA